MDWGNILLIMFGLLAVVGLPLALRSRKRGGQKKVEELCQHLQGIGLKASALEKEISQDKQGQKRTWGQKPVGTIKLTDQDIDSINVIGVASQYGVSYLLDYLVRSSSLTGRDKKTKMIIKKNSLLRRQLLLWASCT